MKFDISIITPAHNPGSLIFSTFDSLNNQSLKNFEWIIVDDFSDSKNKKHFETIGNTANFSVRIIENKINLRQAKSKNIGLNVAKGDFIKFLDADDFLDKYHIANQMERMLKKGDAQNYALFSPTLNFFGLKDSRKQYVNKTYKTVSCNNHEQLKRFLVFPFFSHCGCLFKKEDLLDINGFDESLITDEDGDLILRLMINGMTFDVVENSFYYYRQHSNERVSRNDSNEKWEHRLKVCLKLEQQLALKFPDLMEQLAQRLDILGLQSYYVNREFSHKFFSKAKQVYPGYEFAGNKSFNFMRKYFGTSFSLKLKKLTGW